MDPDDPYFHRMTANLAEEAWATLPLVARLLGLPLPGMRMLLAPSLTGLLVDPLPAFRLATTPLATGAPGVWVVPASAISAMLFPRHCCLHRGFPMVSGGQARHEQIERRVAGVGRVKAVVEGSPPFRHGGSDDNADDSDRLVVGF